MSIETIRADHIAVGDVIKLFGLVDCVMEVTTGLGDKGTLIRVRGQSKRYQIVKPNYKFTLIERAPSQLAERLG